MLRPLVAPHVELRFTARLDVRDDARQLRGALHILTVHGEDHIAGLQAALVAGTTFFHRADERASWTIEAERFGELRVHFLDGHANAAAAHTAGLDQLALDAPRDVDGNGEREAHEAAGAAVNLRVDANHFTREIEQRPTGIAGVHRDVGLDEGHIVVVWQGAGDAADDARSDAVVEAERRTDCHHPLTGAQLARVTDLHGRQTLRVDLDHRDIGALVTADHLRGELAPVGQAHRDVRGAIDHVRIGENVAVGRHDETRAFAACGRRIAASRCRDTEAAEEIGKWVIRRHARRALPATRLPLAADHIDIDDRRPKLADECREVGQPLNHRGGSRCRGRSGSRDGRDRGFAGGRRCGCLR